LGKRVQRPRRAYSPQELDEFERLIIALAAFDSEIFSEVLEHHPMTSLFPTFGSIWQRTKRFLATDTRAIWQRIYEAIQEDEERYQQQLQAKGIDFIV
jgi:hypothetical protein